MVNVEDSCMNDEGYAGHGGDVVTTTHHDDEDDMRPVGGGRGSLDNHDV